MSNDAGAEPLKGKRDLDKAKAADQGEPATRARRSCDDRHRPADRRTPRRWSSRGAARELGLNVDLQAMDWGTLITRRTSKEPLGQGRLEHLPHLARRPRHDSTRPLNSALRANGEKAWFGWPKDPKIEELRDALVRGARSRGAARSSPRAFRKRHSTSVPYVPTGQFVMPTAYRKNLKGVIVAPVVLLWNVEKKVSAPRAAYNCVRLYRPPPSRDHPGHGGRRALRLLAALHLTPGRSGGDHRRRHRDRPRTSPASTRSSGSTSRSCVQFGDWVWGVLHGDLGISIFTNLPVTQLIGQRRRADARR